MGQPALAQSVAPANECCLLAPTGAVTCLANSFVPGTAVLMADGTTKLIEDVEIGDWVWAHDSETGKAGPRQVIDTIIGDGEKQLVDIEVLGDTITATDGHPFWVTNHGAWVDADDLEVGDQLLLADGATAPVAATGDQTAIRRVHNLSVEGIHSYFVEAAGEHVLVHNTSCPPRLHWSALTGEETTTLHTTLTQIRNSDYVGLNRHAFDNVDGQLPEGVNYVIHDVASEASDRGVTGSVRSRRYWKRREPVLHECALWRYWSVRLLRDHFAVAEEASHVRIHSSR